MVFCKVSTRCICDNFMLKESATVDFIGVALAGVIFSTPECLTKGRPRTVALGD